MARQTVVPGAASKIDKLIAHLDDKYKARKFVVQVLEIHDEKQNGKLFQMKESSGSAGMDMFKGLTGMGTAASIKLLVRGNDLEVEVFGGKWLDKAAGAAVSMVVLWPLLITSGIGVWKQNALLDDLYKEVTLFLAGDTNFPALAPTLAPMSVPNTHCPNCGNPISAAMKFCGNCGKKLGA